MTKNKNWAILCVAAGFLFLQGCVAVPPLINVNHRDTTPAESARLAEMEKRLERIEQKLDKLDKKP